MIKDKLLSMQDFRIESLLDPVSLQEFLEKYWEKEPLILHRENPDYYRQLFGIDKVDQVLDLNRPTGGSIRVVKSQQPLLASKYENPDGSLNLNQLYAAYADGYTVVINEIERFWQPLKILTREMSEQLSHHTVANMYMTPKHQQALSPHYDTHDVFVIQVHGKKHWRIYDTTVETPLHNSFQPIFKREQLKNCREITVCAGDVMYMPRGVPHDAYTTDESSLHLTIGVHPAQWLDLINKTIQHLAYSKTGLRKALPPGYLRGENLNAAAVKEIQAHVKQLLEEVCNEANVMGGMHLLSEEFRGHQIPRADGHFASLDQMDEITLETTLHKRQNMSCVVHNLGSVARIVFPGNTIKGPSHIAPALQYIAQAKGPFSVNSLPSMSDANKVKLAARLIRGGLLQVC